MLEMTTDGARGALGGGRTGPAAPVEEADGAADLSSDFETFLKMLTAQLRNQDPLNPMESNDFAVQLATFSGVEQQVLTNELLRGMAGGSGAGGAGHAGWIGLDALSPAPALFDGVPIELAFEAPSDATVAALVVTDAAGREVGREAIDPSGGRATWAGTDALGGPLPSGTYEFSLRIASPEGVEEALPVLSYARVREVRPDPDGTRIVLDGGAEVAADEVAALRAPG